MYQHALPQLEKFAGNFKPVYFSAKLFLPAGPQVIEVMRKGSEIVVFKLFGAVRNKRTGKKALSVTQVADAVNAGNNSSKA